MVVTVIISTISTIDDQTNERVFSSSRTIYYLSLVGVKQSTSGHQVTQPPETGLIAQNAFNLEAQIALMDSLATSLKFSDYKGQHAATGAEPLIVCGRALLTATLEVARTVCSSVCK
jgi:hypothetical protein